MFRSLISVQPRHKRIAKSTFLIARIVQSIFTGIYRNIHEDEKIFIDSSSGEGLKETFLHMLHEGKFIIWIVVQVHSKNRVERCLTAKLMSSRQ